MSMREWSVDEYGLLLDSKMMKVLAKRICKDYTENDYDEDPYAFNEEVEQSLGNIDYISSFSGAAFGLNDDGTDNGMSAVYFSDDVVYILPISNTPSLFKAAYSNMDELVGEFNRRMHKYFPHQSLKENIRHLVGTYFG